MTFESYDTVRMTKSRPGRLITWKQSGSACLALHAWSGSAAPLSLWLHSAHLATSSSQCCI